MPFMQLDVAPAVIGVSIYTLFWLLTRALKPARKAKEVAADVEAVHKHTLQEVDVQEEEEPEPVPEPAAEPEVEDADADIKEAPGQDPAIAQPQPAKAAARVPSTRGPSRAGTPTFLWRLLKLGLAAFLLLPPLGHYASLVLQTPESAPETPQARPTKVQAEADDEDEDETKPQIPTQCQKDEDPGDGEEAFSVRLTRQVMNDANYIRSAYYGTLMVGTPAMEMTVVFDTGSGHLVLPSMYCKSETCRVHNRYRRSASTTARDPEATTGQAGYRDSITVSFGTGEVTGVFVEDIICMNQLTNTSNLTSEVGSRPECTRLHFIAATELSEDPFAKFHFDGILGLGLSGLSQTSEFNFMEVMARSIRGLGGRNPLTFGVYLADHDHEDSEIALGGWSKRHLAEDLSWGPVHDPELGHWIVPVRGVRVGDHKLDFCDDGRCRAAVDTGTSLMAVPSVTFREIYEQLRHAAPLAGHCMGHGPLLHIELSEFTVTLGPKDYGQVKKTHRNLYPKPALLAGPARSRPDLRCLPMLMTLDLEEPIGPKVFILGEPVLRKYYTVYDAQRMRVGIGRAKHRKAPSREEVLQRAPEFEPVARGRLPTMFDAFRWRRQLR